MRKTLVVLIALLCWFAVIAQFVLMLQTTATSLPETIIRFFSYFTILTNTLVALFFTAMALNVESVNKPGLLSAITVYIFMVGIVYQVLLRHIWQPQGLQQVVDELLHTINPLLVLVFWGLYEKKSDVAYSQIKGWLIYPLVYLLYILIRGHFSDFYPYPFVNVVKIGIGKALINSVLLTFAFLGISFLLIAIGKKMSKQIPLSQMSGDSK